MLILAPVLILTLSDVPQKASVGCDMPGLCVAGTQSPEPSQPDQKVRQRNSWWKNGWNPDSKLRMFETTWVGGHQVPPLGDQSIKIEPRQPEKNHESHIYQSNW